MARKKLSLQNHSGIHEHVRKRYARIAQEASPEVAANCCSVTSMSSISCCGGDSPQTLIPVSQLYETADVNELPKEVTTLSLGCGDPVTLAALKPGQTVLDLGSGGGIDCFLAARQVGADGFVVGVDMTFEMVERACANRARMGITNVDFQLGEIEHLPIADNSVDVVISNCVINLSPDKPQVFREAFRVLKPGGLLSVSDIVTEGPLPEEIRGNPDAWADCVAGALDVQEYLNAIRSAGFEEIQLTSSGCVPRQTVFSAKITARKPLGFGAS